MSVKSNVKKFLPYLYMFRVWLPLTFFSCVVNLNTVISVQLHNQLFRNYYQVTRKERFKKEHSKPNCLLFYNKFKTIFYSEGTSFTVYWMIVRYINCIFIAALEFISKRPVLPPASYLQAEQNRHNKQYHPLTISPHVQ